MTEWITVESADGPMRVYVARPAGEAGVEFEQHVYDGAGHAFAADARPDKYQPRPAATAWERTHAFLDQRLPASS